MASRSFGFPGLLLMLFGCANSQASTSHVPALTASNFDEFLAANSLVLVKFHMPWCGWCQKLKPHYEEAASRLDSVNQGKSLVRLASLDASSKAEETLLRRYEIKSFPSVVLFSNQEMQYRHYAFDFDDFFDFSQTFNVYYEPFGFFMRIYYRLRSLYKFGVKALLKTLKYPQDHLLMEILPQLLAPLLVLALLVLWCLGKCCCHCCCRRSAKKKVDEVKAKAKKSK
eukprot:TRINITY_DN6885_c0_g2_i1.p1 TRINITY_DN6885_c0_g2~~TRINITY_DN6885_c0_g2_i1.p1  ORF type:complete len:227 (-),score=36.20 TRINITY_DN6885_c0_g2_i1:83-763(-)